MQLDVGSKPYLSQHKPPAYKGVQTSVFNVKPRAEGKTDRRREIQYSPFLKKIKIKENAWICPLEL